MSPISLHSLFCLFDPRSTVHTSPCYLSGTCGFSPIKNPLGRSCMYSNTLQLAITQFRVLLHFMGSSCYLFQINSLSLIFLVWYWDFETGAVLFQQMTQLKSTRHYYTLFYPNINLLYPKISLASSPTPHWSFRSPSAMSPTSWSPDPLPYH
jgi:hypothetical protein